MIVSQHDLLHASIANTVTSNLHESRGGRSKPLIHILHNFEDFRLVEGLITYFRKAQIEGDFQWKSGYDLPLLQSDLAKNEKDQIVLSDVVIFLATYKSMNNSINKSNLEFAKSIQKRVYVFPTRFEKTVFGESLYPEYPLLYIEKSNLSGALNLKEKKPNQKNFLTTISSVRML